MGTGELPDKNREFPFFSGVLPVKAGTRNRDPIYRVSKKMPCTKDNLCCIISQPIRREGYDVSQMILGIFGHLGDSQFPFFPPVPGINRIAPVSTRTKSLVPDIFCIMAIRGDRPGGTGAIKGEQRVQELDHYVFVSHMNII